MTCCPAALREVSGIAARGLLRRIAYVLYVAEKPIAPIDPELLAEFEAAARRPLALRMKYAFIKTYKPVIYDEVFRSFETMEQYRQWCEANLPSWLGYGRV